MLTSGLKFVVAVTAAVGVRAAVRGDKNKAGAAAVGGFIGASALAFQSQKPRTSPESSKKPKQPGSAVNGRSCENVSNDLSALGKISSDQDNFLNNDALALADKKNDLFGLENGINDLFDFIRLIAD